MGNIQTSAANSRIRFQLLRFVSLFRYDPLKEKLRSRSLTDREALPYLLSMFGFAAAAVVFPFPLGSEWVDRINQGGTILLAVLGLLYSYRQNGGAKGHDLALKYIVLGEVVVMRCTLAAIPAGILLIWLGNQLGLRDRTLGWYDTLLWLLFQVVAYQRLGRQIADTR